MKASILALFVAAAAAAVSPIQDCLAACPVTDVNCKAICVGVPHQGEAQMTLVTDCVANCDQGDGSTEASNAYGRCRDVCISSYIITSGTAAPGGAYTTPPIPGVSQTGVAAVASAAASDVQAAGGLMTTATFLLPVDHSIACLYHPRYSMATVEVYPFPKHVLYNLDCHGDGTVTLSYGQEFSYLPTPYARSSCTPCPTTVASMPISRPSSYPKPWPGKPTDLPSSYGGNSSEVPLPYPSKPTGPRAFPGEGPYAGKPTNIPASHGGKPSGVPSAFPGKPSGPSPSKPMGAPYPGSPSAYPSGHPTSTLPGITLSSKSSAPASSKSSGSGTPSAPIPVAPIPVPAGPSAPISGKPSQSSWVAPSSAHSSAPSTTPLGKSSSPNAGGPAPSGSWSGGPGKPTAPVPTGPLNGPPANSVPAPAWSQPGAPSNQAPAPVAAYPGMITTTQIVWTPKAQAATTVTESEKAQSEGHSESETSSASRAASNASASAAAATSTGGASSISVGATGGLAALVLGALAWL